MDDTHPITRGVSSFEVHDEQHFTFIDEHRGAKLLLKNRGAPPGTQSQVTPALTKQPGWSVDLRSHLRGRVEPSSRARSCPQPLRHFRATARAPFLKRLYTNSKPTQLTRPCLALKARTGPSPVRAGHLSTALAECAVSARYSLPCLAFSTKACLALPCLALPCLAFSLTFAAFRCVSTAFPLPFADHRPGVRARPAGCAQEHGPASRQVVRGPRFQFGIPAAVTTR